MMLRGLTVWYLVRVLHVLKPGETVLLHAAAGGIGLLFCQWARAIGATVIGTVSSDEKAKQAKAAGCTHIRQLPHGRKLGRESQRPFERRCLCRLRRRRQRRIHGIT